MPSIETYQFTQDEPVQLSPSQVRTVAIIGGGASGAVISDSLLKEAGSSISKITLFERRSKLGGVWALDTETIKTPNHIVRPGYNSLKVDPQLENPFHKRENSNKFDKLITTPKIKQERFEETPSYQGITTNIIEKMMTYSDVNQWTVPGVEDPEERKYVNGLVVKDYIEAYITRNLDNDKFSLIQNSTVEDVEKIPKQVSSPDEIPYKFRLTIRQPLNEESDVWYQEDFDSVVVATGHYHIPQIPYVKGLSELQEKYEDVVQHAKFYRNPDPYEGKDVVVVGSRASGADLTKYIADKANNVYQSIRNLENTKRLSKKPNIIYKPIIKEYQILPDNKGFKVIFEDDTEITNPDHVIYATGYSFSYPYLNRLTNGSITKDGGIIPDLYQHTFHINEPLLAFVGVPIDGVSFRVFEYQAILVSRYLAGKIALPNRIEQRRWADERYEQKGNTRAYHTIGVVDALGYLGGLVKLGEISNAKLNIGRQFPPLKEEDLALYRAAGERLRQFWDER
ncbi:flavin-containing monooxygenase [Scheffersomyces xylosifermentans]|uniref:flavin-containing monooxygenase n=1 Tax=Scheffersomyces xylosifermentans TaxID=1304137 RepID=UPI00315CAB77